MKGYNYRRVKNKPNNYDTVAKNRRLNFAENNVDLDLSQVVFLDETSLKTCRNGLYINRKKSSHPKAAGTHPRNVKTLHILAGISMKRPIVLYVSVVIKQIQLLFFNIEY